MRKIELIITEKKSIDLAPQGVPENFFPIDSATLIIGKNGSGKTTLLKEIANPKNSKFLWSSGDDTSDRPEIIYFNPTQQKKIRRDTRHFRDASNATPFFSFENCQGMFDGVFEKASYEIAIDSTAIARDVIRLLIGYLTQGTPQKQESSNLYRNEQRKEFFERIITPSSLISKMSIERTINIIAADFIGAAWTMLKRAEFIILFSTLNDLTKRKKETIDIIDCIAYFLSKGSNSSHWLKSEAYKSWMRNIDYVSHVLSLADRHKLEGRNKIKIYNTDLSFDKSSIFKPCLDSYSSGESAIIRQFGCIQTAINELYNAKNILLLIDEGDALLHVEWQAEYIKALMHFLSQIRNRHSSIETIQLILATHSPIVASDFPKELITSLDDTIPSEINTFATPIDILISGCLGSKAIGDFAASKINNACKDFNNGNSKHLEYIFTITDNPVIKSGISDLLEKRMRKDQ